MHTVIVKSGREYQILRGHPWVFSGAIHNKIQSEVGEVVRLESQSKQFLGYGFYEGQSIAVKVIAGAKSEPDHKTWLEKLVKARNYRKILGLPKKNFNTAYRLVHAEGDGIPGLIIDIYETVAVVEFHGAGARRLRSLWQELLFQLIPELTSVLFRDDIESNALIDCQPVTIFENALKIKVDFAGQKTGYFLDQADSRESVKKYAANRKVLDCFCYSGGFTLAALAGGCDSVLSVDSSEHALKQVESNIALNFADQASIARVLKADCLHWLHQTEDFFDLIVLDPPAFVKNRSALKGGVVGYQTINKLAFQKLNSQGLLYTFSCSQLISEYEFEELVLNAAVLAGVNARVVRHFEQAVSHAYNLSHPEGRYLKGLLLYVD